MNNENVFRLQSDGAITFLIGNEYVDVVLQNGEVFVQATSRFECNDETKLQSGPIYGEESHCTFMGNDTDSIRVAAPNKSFIHGRVYDYWINDQTKQIIARYGHGRDHYITSASHPDSNVIIEAKRRAACRKLS